MFPFILDYIWNYIFICKQFRIFYGEVSLDPRTYPQPEGPKTFGSEALHMQNIHSYPPRMEAVCSIYKLLMPDHMVTRIYYCLPDTREKAAV
jgi:hypothetical protein